MAVTDISICHKGRGLSYHSVYLEELYDPDNTDSMWDSGLSGNCRYCDKAVVFVEDEEGYSDIHTQYGMWVTRHTIIEWP